MGVTPKIITLFTMTSYDWWKGDGRFIEGHPFTNPNLPYKEIVDKGVVLSVTPKFFKKIKLSRFRAGTAYKYLDESFNNLTYIIIYWTRSPNAELTHGGKVPNRSFSLKLLTLQFFQCPPVLR